MNRILQKEEKVTSTLQSFFIAVEHTNAYEVEGRKLSRSPHWKKHFYKAYRHKEHALAAAIYFSKHPYRSDLMDVHQGYKLERRTDKELLVAGSALVLIIISTIVGLIHLL